MTMEENGKNNLNKENDCWNSIGVWSRGIASCPKLKEIVHCRNCDKFVASGRRLLDREPMDDYLLEWTDFLAEEREDIHESEEPVIIFRLENEWFALPCMILKEVAESRTIHRIPHRTDNVFLGMSNIDGDLQLCFSLKDFFGIEKSAPRHEAKSALKADRFIVVEKNNYSWVFPVDEVCGIYRYNINEIQNVPPTVSKAAESYTTNVFEFDGKTVGYLDDELIIYSLNRSIM